MRINISKYSLSSDEVDKALPRK